MLKPFLLATLTMPFLTACATPSVSTHIYSTDTKITPADQPHIQRLAVWLSGDGINFDQANLDRSLKATLGARGMQVSTGISTTYQFAESDAEKALVASSGATHRLDIKVVSRTSGSTIAPIWPNPFAIAAGAALSRATARDQRTVRLVLFSGDESKPLWEGSTYTYGRIGSSTADADIFAAYLIQAWEKAGVL